jgi:hypothetical protein
MDKTWNLLQRFLILAPKRRITITDALRDGYFAVAVPKPQIIDTSRVYQPLHKSNSGREFAVLCSYVWEVAEFAKLQLDTVFMAIQILRTELSEMYIETQKLQLICIACLRLAALYCGCWNRIPLDLVISSCGGISTICELIAKEKELLQRKRNILR